MPYIALAACLGWVVTTCLFVWVLKLILTRQDEERRAHRTEVAHAARALGEMSQAHRLELAGIAASHSADMAAVHATHGERIEKLIEGHRQEVANLCQRLQAPQVAVAEHVGQNTLQDPPQVDLENSAMLSEIQRRENDLQMLANSLTERAEGLAAER
jgi:hypothetical protein